MKTLVFDIETTGLPPKDADYKTQYMDFPYIVSMAWKVDDQPTQHFIINQEGRKIPQEVTDIHGITNEMAEASEYRLLAVLAMFGMQAGKPDFVIGHNMYFDTSIIKANILRLIDEKKAEQEFYQSIEELLHKDRRVDTMRKSIKFCALPKSKWPKLTELYEKCFPGEAFEAHNAKDDVEATHRCYHRLKELLVI